MFSQFGITGIFVCFTGESCVNPDTYEVWLPFTMCHELAHRQTVAAEDGANFCAYLACMENESPEFQYSGAIAAYVYCHNALYKADKTAASEIWADLSDGVRADIQAANEHYAQYEGKVQDAATKVNDTYLKAFSEESGCAELRRSGGSAHCVVSEASVSRKTAKTKKNVLDKRRELFV